MKGLSVWEWAGVSAVLVACMTFFTKKLMEDIDYIAMDWSYELTWRIELDYYLKALPWGVIVAGVLLVIIWLVFRDQEKGPSLR